MLVPNAIVSHKGSDAQVKVIPLRDRRSDIKETAIVGQRVELLVQSANKRLLVEVVKLGVYKENTQKQAGIPTED